MAERCDVEERGHQGSCSPQLLARALLFADQLADVS